MREGTERSGRTRKVRATRRGPGGCGREQGLEGSIGTGSEGCRGDRKQAVKAVAWCLTTAALPLLLRAVGSHVSGSHNDCRVPSRVLDSRDRACSVICVPCAECCSLHSCFLTTAPDFSPPPAPCLGTVQGQPTRLHAAGGLGFRPKAMAVEALHARHWGQACMFICPLYPHNIP